MPSFQPKHMHYVTDARQLVEIGMMIEPNTVWSFKEMAEQLGRPMEGSDQALQRALRVLARDHGKEFKNIRNVGYLRLNDEGIVGEAPRDREGVKRRVKRAALRSSNVVDWNALADPLKRELDAHRSILALLRHIVTPKAVKRVRSEVDKLHDELPLTETLKLFRKEADPK